MAKQDINPALTEKQASGFYDRMLHFAERFESSIQIFIIVVIVACAVEVFLGWKDYFSEVTIIRNRLEEKATSYLGVLSRAGLRPVLSYDWDQMDLYAKRMLEDEDVIFIRFVDTRAQTIYEKTKQNAYIEKFIKNHNAPPKEYFDKILHRDTQRVLYAPETLEQLKVEETRRDLITVMQEAIDTAMSSLGLKEQNTVKVKTLTYYQDHLKGEVDNFGFGITPVIDKLHRTWGGVILGFSLDRINNEIRSAFFSNLAITLIFIAIIFVNNIFSRREKLAAKAMANDIAEAKAFFSRLLPHQPPSAKHFQVFAAHTQSSDLGGGFYDIRTTPVGLELFIANAASSGLASSYAASMAEALILRRARSGELPSPDEFMQQAHYDFGIANLNSSIDILFALIKRSTEHALLELASANVMLPLIFRNQKLLNKPDDVLQGYGSPINNTTDLDVHTHNIELYDGDRVVFLIDGLEQNDPKRLITNENLLDKIEQTQEQEDPALALCSEINKLYKDNPPDDIIVIVIDLNLQGVI